MNGILGYYHLLTAQPTQNSENPELKVSISQENGSLSEINYLTLEKLAGTRVMLLFLADWLPFKKKLLEVMGEVKQERIILVDPEKSPLLIDKFGVITLPTLVLLVRGKEEARLIGAFGSAEVLRLKSPASR